MNRNSVSPAPPVYDSPLTVSSNTDLFSVGRSTPAPILAEPKKFINKPDKPKKPKKQQKSAGKIKCIKFARVFVKKFGMLIGTTIYCIGGSYLFNILEAQNELAGCEGSASDMAGLITDYQMKIFNYLNFNVTFNPALVAMTADQNTVFLDGPDKYNLQVHDWLVEFRDEILSNGYGGEDCETVNSWQFLSGLLWTITVVTSIGYGHTSPSTWEGQTVLICYALLGMPLFLLTCAEISVMLADFFVLLYKHFFCLPCNIYSQYKIIQADREEELAYNEGNEDEDQDAEMPPMEDQDDFMTKKSDFMEPDQLVVPLPDNEEISSSFGDEEEPEVRVPLIIIMGTLFGFLIGGGYLFKYLEDWDVVVGVYFTYISITSVGFGDYSPGTTDMGAGNKLKASRNLLIGTVWLVIGMSIMGMCFSLMADGLVDNFKLLFERLGLAEKEEETESDGYVDMTELEEDINQAQSSIVKVRSKKKGAPKAGEEFNNRNDSSSSDSESDEPKYIM